MVPPRFARFVAGTAIAVLALSSMVLGAPAEPGPILEAGGSVADIAMAANGWIAGGAIDSGGDGLGQTANLDTWRLWDIEGDLRRLGTSDESTCASDLFDTCTSHAWAVAISSDGSRMAVAARDQGEEDGRVIFISANQGVLATMQLDGEIPQHVAMTPSGGHVVVGTTQGAVTGADTGRVHLYAWAAGGIVTQSWMAATAEPATEVAISPDGARVAATAGDHYRFGATGQDYRSQTILAGANSVAFSSTSNHWSVATFSNGEVALFNDASDVAPFAPAYSTRPTTTGQDVGAIWSDATHFLVAGQDNKIRFYQNPLLVATAKALVATSADLGAPVLELALAGDHSTVLSRAGTTVRMHRADATLATLWNDTRVAAFAAIAIDATGEHAAAAAGQQVILYTAKHELTVGFPVPFLVTPGATTQLPLRLANSGNRDEQATLTTTAPPGWTVTGTGGTKPIRVDQGITWNLNVTVPSGQANGDATIRVTYQFASGGFGFAEIPVTIGQVKRWTLTPDGALSVGGEGGVPAQVTGRAANVGNGRDTAELAVTVDKPGWTASLSPTSLTLDAGEDAAFTVTVTPPASARDGDNAKAAVRVAGDSAAALDITVTIGARFGVSLTAVPAQGNPAPLQSHGVTLTVKNTGNAPDAYRLRLGALVAGWSVSFEGASDTFLVIGLDPGATRSVPASVQVGRDARTATYELQAIATSLGDATKTTMVPFDVTVIAREPASETSGGEGTGKGKGSPGGGVLASLTALGVAVALIRRRPGRFG